MTYVLALLATILAWGGPRPDDGGAGAPPEDGVTVAIDPVGAARGPVVLPNVTPARGEDPPLVVVDPGHGGRDPGAASPYGGVEKNVTLALARRIRDDLARSGRVRVALTREDDRYLLLQERYEIARRLGADLFISIHADAAPHNDGARGATIYTLSEVASDRQAALLAQRQNEADLIGGVAMSRDPAVNVILIDLAQRESMNVSADFARILYREAAPVFPFRPEWHKFASLVVLKAPDIPSVLFESGYLTNAVDAAYLQSPEGQSQIADGMRRAVEAHFARLRLQRRA
jgi:N-acetylmuramoyl-L-alanine amidase